MNLIIKNFYRDLRAGNLTLILFSLIIAVSSISCISFLSDRVKQSLNKDMQSSLAADRRLVSDRPIPDEWINLADKLLIFCLFILVSNFNTAFGQNPKGYPNIFLGPAQIQGTLRDEEVKIGRMGLSKTWHKKQNALLAFSSNCLTT